MARRRCCTCSDQIVVKAYREEHTLSTDPVLSFPLGSHSKRSPSMPPLASSRASGDHATHRTQFLWPAQCSHSCTHIRTTVCTRHQGHNVSRHQGRNVPTPAAVLGQERPARGGGLDTPVNVLRGVCVWMSHSLTVVSPDPLASCLPSGLNATVSTASVWPAVDPSQGDRASAVLSNSMYRASCY